jgi:GTP-binding protein
VDTGGYVPQDQSFYERAIEEQILIALAEAHISLFVVDAQTGVIPADEQFADLLRKLAKPTLLVVNKTESFKASLVANSFYALGMGEVHEISATHGTGTGDLLDLVVELLPPPPAESPEESLPRLALLGRPNVGKSTFLNTLLGAPRTIVSDTAHTTRDAIDARYTLYGKECIITDTAGIRKKSAVDGDIEFYATMRSIQAMEQSDVCIILIDAVEGITVQDKQIIQLASKRGRGILLLVNKWDLIPQDPKAALAYKRGLLGELGNMAHLPVLFTSGLKKKGVYQTIEKALTIYASRKQRIATSALNKMLEEATAVLEPPVSGGRRIRIKYCTQLPSPTPIFAFFCNAPGQVPDAYKAYLEKRMRSRFSLEGVPIKLVFRQK